MRADRSFDDRYVVDLLVGQIRLFFDEEKLLQLGVSVTTTVNLTEIKRKLE